MDYELKISQAAELLDVSESRVSQLVSSGAIDSITRGGKRRISKSSVEYYRDHVRKTGRPPKPRDRVHDLVLMNASHEVMRLSYDETSDAPLTGTEVLDPDRCPWGVVTSGGKAKKRELNDWWRSRSIPHARPGIDTKLAELQLSESYEIPFANFGLSLSDCYWVRSVDGGEVPSWSSINFFQNDFAGQESEGWDDWLANVGLNSPDNTSEGALPKKWAIRDGRRVLLKGSTSDDQRPVNEVVASALHERLLGKDEHVAYSLAETPTGLACACENFLGPHEEFIPASSIMGTVGNIRGSSLYDRFCRYVGMLGPDEGLVREWMAKIIVCDAILANSDRHRRNFGLIRDVETLELRCAPIFDSGNCLWYDKTTPQVKAKDWSYVARPFGPEPERQLALVENARWFDASALEGFVDQATEILSASEHAVEGDRLAYIREGLEQQVEHISGLMRVLRYR